MQIKDFFSLFLLIVHKRLHFLNTHIIFIIMYLSENPNIMVSSAHEIWVIFGVSFGIPQPLYILFSCSLFIPLASISVTIINSMGDIGFPCLRPLIKVKKSCDIPLTSTEYQLFYISLQTISTMIYEFLSSFTRKIKILYHTFLPCLIVQSHYYLYFFIDILDNFLGQ